MQRLIWFVLMLSLFLTLGLAGRSTAQRGSSADRTSAADDQWEYLVVSGGNVNLNGSGVDSRMRKQPDDSFQREAYALERNLDKLGAKGWILVAVHGAPNDPIFYFKRPKEHAK